MPRIPRRYPTEAELQTILTKLEQGIPKTRIANEMGICPKLVTRWLDEYDGLIRPRHYPKYGKKAAHEHCGIYFDVTTIGENK